MLQPSPCVALTLACSDDDGVFTLFCLFLHHMWCCDTSGITPRDISLFIVEKGTEGFDIGQKIEDKVYDIY